MASTTSRFGNTEAFELRSPNGSDYNDLMPSPFETAWFRRRKFGLGWALHRTWQGWLLMIAYVSAATGGVAWFGERPRVLAAYLTTLAIVALLLCWWKGERSLRRGETSERPAPSR